MPISVKKEKGKANDLMVNMAPKTREGRSENPKERKAYQTIDPETSYRQERNNKIEMIKSRVTKQSVSPDKYTINSNLVVQLADPVKKTDASRKI